MHELNGFGGSNQWIELNELNGSRELIELVELNDLNEANALIRLSELNESSEAVTQLGELEELGEKNELNELNLDPGVYGTALQGEGVVSYYAPCYTQLSSGKLRRFSGTFFDEK